MTPAAPRADRSRVALLAAALLATAASAVATVVSFQEPAGIPPRVLGEKLVKPPAALSFTLAASVSGLQPGMPATLPVVVTNPAANGGALTVKTLVVMPRNAGRGCGAANVTVTPYDAGAAGATPYVVPSGGATTVPLRIVLADSPSVDQDSCRGRTFPLRIDAVGDVAR